MTKSHKSVATMKKLSDLLGTTWGAIVFGVIFSAVAAIVTILILT